MKKIISLVIISIIALTLTGCTSAETVSYNISREYKAIYIITSILVEIAIILYGIGTIMILKSYREKVGENVSSKNNIQR